MVRDGAVVPVPFQVDPRDARGAYQLTDAVRTFDADETMWVTQAGGPAWLQGTGLALDEHGFVCVNEYLQTPDDPKIFAAGDVASFLPRPLEKAGVISRQ